MLLTSNANPSDPTQKELYCFDDVVVDTHNFVVTKNDELVTLTPRAFDVLSLLLRSGGHVVEKRQMFDEVWHDTFVSDNALTKVIKELRHTLGDSAEHPKYIETIPKRGYRFIGTFREAALHRNGTGNIPVGPVAQPRPRVKVWMAGLAVVLTVAVAGAGWLSFTSDVRSGRPASIAVLPFKPLDAGSRDESLELGMATTLITRLSNLRDIVVRPIGSARKFNDPTHDPIKAGEELQVEAVIDGSIQKDGDRVRISVRLLDVRSGTALWSEQFDENFTDIFKVQDSISERIASVLALRLSRNEQEQLAKHMTDNPEAYELYLRGQFHWHRRGPNWIRESLHAFKAALEKDPDFALAHIGVADAYIMMSGHRQIGVAEAARHAEPSITRALEIDNTLAQAHNALAEFKYQYQYDWRGAEAEFKTAIELNPNVAWIHQAYGWFLMSEGRFDEASNEMERARELDPSSLTLAVARGRLFYYSRQYDRAIRHYLELLQQEPGEQTIHYSLYTIYVQKRMYPEAIDSLMRSQGPMGMSEKFQNDLRAAFAAEGWDGFLRKALSEIDRLRAKTGNEFPGLYHQLYLQLGDRERAIATLEKLVERRDVSVVQAKIEPTNDLVREDPRFEALLQRIGLEP